MLPRALHRSAKATASRPAASAGPSSNDSSGSSETNGTSASVPSNISTSACADSPWTQSSRARSDAPARMPKGRAGHFVERKRLWGDRGLGESGGSERIEA
eukprot:scaffold13524_cov109-Isochrysis_galbana.AAC.10